MTLVQIKFSWLAIGISVCGLFACGPSHHEENDDHVEYHDEDIDVFITNNPPEPSSSISVDTNSDGHPEFSVTGPAADMIISSLGSLIQVFGSFFGDGFGGADIQPNGGDQPAPVPDDDLFAPGSIEDLPNGTNVALSAPTDGVSGSPTYGGHIFIDLRASYAHRKAQWDMVCLRPSDPLVVARVFLHGTPLLSALGMSENDLLPLTTLLTHPQFPLNFSWACRQLLANGTTANSEVRSP